MTVPNTAATTLYPDPFHSRGFERTHELPDTKPEKLETEYTGITIKVETLDDGELDEIPQSSISFSEPLTLGGNGSVVFGDGDIIVETIPASLDALGEGAEIKPLVVRKTNEASLTGLGKGLLSLFAGLAALSFLVLVLAMLTPAFFVAPKFALFLTLFFAGFAAEIVLARKL